MKNTVIFVLILETYITYLVSLLNKNTEQVYSAMTVTNWKSGTESWGTNHWH